MKRSCSESASDLKKMSIINIVAVTSDGKRLGPVRKVFKDDKISYDLNKMIWLEKLGLRPRAYNNYRFVINEDGSNLRTFDFTQSQRDQSIHIVVVPKVS